jgi:hypothetical protein
VKNPFALVIEDDPGLAEVFSYALRAAVLKLK